jgi:uncharacterized protein (TIGR02145 family)
MEPTTTTTTTCDPLLCDYGLLYNWYAVDTGKLAPTDWHVPSDAEWTTLTTWLINNGYLSDGWIDGDEIVQAMSSQCYWKHDMGGYWPAPPRSPGYNLTQNNESGFSGIPAGSRYSSGDFYYEEGYFSIWHSSTEYSSTQSWYRSLYYENTYCERGYGSPNSKKQGCSIRCVRDTYEGWENDVPVVDYDGNEYDVVEIGTQLWLVQNLKVTHYNDGESIPNVTDGTTWSNLTTGALCAYNNDWGTYACVPEPTTTTTTTSP